MRALPGVQGAACILHGHPCRTAVRRMELSVPQGAPPMQDSRAAHGGRFGWRRPDTSAWPGIFPLIAGRDFYRGRHGGQSPGVIVLSARTAERSGPGENRSAGGCHAQDDVGRAPRGRRHRRRGSKIGALDAGHQHDSETAIYAPLAQFSFGGSQLMVRTSVPPASLTGAVVGAVHAIDPEQPVLDIATMEQVVDEVAGAAADGDEASDRLRRTGAAAPPRSASTACSPTPFGKRVRDIGIRMALGAPTRSVLRMVVVEGLKPTLVGVAVGLVLAAGLVRVMATLLYGVSEHDPGHLRSRPRARHRCRTAGEGGSRHGGPHASIRSTRCAPSNSSSSPFRPRVIGAACG